LAEGVATFGGVKRRMDIHLDTPEAAYVDDYAHHPAELNALLQAVRERWPGRHVTLVFQPHLYSRTRDFAPEFASVLAQTDRLVLLPIYPAREQPIPGVDAQWLFENISAPHKQLSSSDSIFTSLKAGPLDVLVTAGAGDIDRLVPQALQLMRDRLK
jgi:UDP-N-acetylmuramate--alanine ligase